MHACRKCGYRFAIFTGDCILPCTPAALYPQESWLYYSGTNPEFVQLNKHILNRLKSCRYIKQVRVGGRQMYVGRT